MVQASIVIPTYNKLSRLKVCLKALEPQVTEEVQVIVVFDGCTQEVVEAFKKLNFTYKPTVVICEKNIGRAAARNRGIAVAKGKIVIFIDDDRIPDAGFVQKHIEAHKDKKCAILGSRSEIKLSEEQIEALYLHPGYFEQAKEQANSENIRKFIKIKPYSHIRWIRFYTGNVSVEKEDLDKVQGFDENFTKWGNEDIDLGIRLQQIKVPFYVIDHAVNYHILHESNYINKAKESIESFQYMSRKYKKHPILWCIIKVLIVDLMIRGTPKIKAESVKAFEKIEV